MGYINEFPHAKTWDSDLRQILEEYNALKGLPKDWEDVKNFVTNYFTDLNVQEEINAKIDSLVADGTMDIVCNRIFNEYSNEVEILNSRLNVVTRIAEESEATDLELEVGDGRVDADGKAWDNIGEHLRFLGRESLRYKGYIDEPMNFETLEEEGIYNVLNEAIDGSLNYPSTLGGIIIVIRRSGYEAPVIHLLIDNNGTFYTHYKTLSKGWLGWKEYALKSEFDVVKALSKIERHTDGIGALVEVAETYFNVAYDKADQIVYDSTHGLYNNQLTDMHGRKAIVCSQFEQACIGGITYENSRYVGVDNKVLPWGFVSDGSGVYAYTDWNPYNDYMTACEQARYFENHGMLHTFDVNRNGLKAGDLIFYTTDSLEDESVYYKKITHVAICLAASRDRYTIMHSTDKHIRKVDDKDVGMLVATYRYESKAPEYYVHSPICAEYITKMIGANEVAKAGEYSSSSVYLDNFTFDDRLQRGFYTLDFEDTGDSNGYIKVYYEHEVTQAEYTVNFNAIKNGNVNKIVFYAEMPVKQIDIRVSDGTSYKYNWAKLYKGYNP